MPKRLVVCLDGTWNRADDHDRSSNVVALMRAVAPQDGEGVPQVVHYGKGVGTGGGVDRLLGGLTGSGLEANLKAAYIFLGNNFEPGDEVYIFGFSRGAYTARSLAGFISACGLLGRWNLGKLPQAWAWYRDPKGRPADAKQRLGSADIDIACVGVWDTVGSLGIPLRWWNPFHAVRRRHQFHNTELSGRVRRAFHAVAADERRGPFPPTLWQKRKGEPLPEGQVVEQVWFAGAHSDVGGGYGRSDQQGNAIPCLSPLALRWMVARVQATTRLAFRPDWEALTAAGDPLAPQHESRTGLYLLSRVLPYQRVIGGQDGWTRRFLPSRNRPARGNEFIGEAIHPSLLARVGQPVETVRSRGRRRAPYGPENVKAAQGKVPVAQEAGKAVAAPLIGRARRAGKGLP